MLFPLSNALAIPKAHGRERNLNCWTGRNKLSVTCSALKPNGYRQFNTAYIEIPKKNGKSELAAAVALLLTCGDGEERAEVYGCAADRQQAAIVFDVAADMVRMCPALSKRVKILTSQKRIVYIPTNSFYQVLSAEAYSKHGFNIHGVVFDELHTQSYPTKGTTLFIIYLHSKIKTNRQA